MMEQTSSLKSGLLLSPLLAPLLKTEFGTGIPFLERLAHPVRRLA
jgi:hypothetical protein